ncbi:MAG: hypothetical protein PHR30_09270 [Gallionellaceae bacterium]|nr:hypothetical protein [Gallionellaceae bacterium]MDD5365516.1 hypothetical protein [Gallionellaceae bacterium]
MSLSRPEARATALRLALWLPILLWLGWRWGWDYAHWFLPLYRDVLGAVLGGFRFADIEIVRSHEYLFRAAYTTARSLVVGGRVVSAGLDGYVQVPVYYALTHAIVLAAAALAWPGLTWRGRAVRLLASLPVLLMLEALDVPLVMYGSINDAVMQTYAAQAYRIDRPVDWVTLLEGGGRSALCIAAAFAAAWLHRSLAAGLGRIGHPRTAR